ncbi:MAG: hypothetical protein IAX21_02790 [Candidatus Bathyarchaeota archaeon]|nr:MAG: hypothetical protein IAX21_02790 [Candidatus Bathyarchaeota archaeon]
MNSIFRNVYFWLSVILLFLAAVLFLGIILDFFDFGFIIGPYRFNHWLGWIGTIFIATYVPLFVLLKPKYIRRIRLLLGIHVVGNLIAYLLITIHFASQISRPAAFYPTLGTGVVQFIFLIILVTTGILQRFNLLSNYRKKWLFLHRSSVLALLMILLFHILHGLGLL